MRRRHLHAHWASLALVLALLSGAAVALPQERVTLGLTTRNGTTSLPFVIAEEKGFFKSEGVNGVIVIMQNAVVVNGVVARNVDYGGTFSNFIGAALSGLPVRIVMSAMDGSDHYLVTAPSIKRVEISAEKGSASAVSAGPRTVKRS
jgi:ABC-type nitrate/sulfonate/bicarbonate transport system substrate-binding protein